MYNTLLKQAREAVGFSQADLARRIGINAKTVSEWERYEHRPSAYFLAKLCSALGKSAAELGFPPEFPPGAAAISDPSLPFPASPLVGRDQPLAQLRQRLLANRPAAAAALTVLLGLPGVGKTALAVALAHDRKIRRRFRDGVLWAGLGMHPDSSSLLFRWGNLLGIGGEEMALLRSNEARARAVHSALASRSMLLVLDDAWSVEDVVHFFKVGGPRCAHVVTTRFPRVATHLSIDSVTRVEPLPEEDGMALLHALAPEVMEHEAARAQQLVQAVGGLPLALTLMGNYLRKEAYGGQRRRIAAALERVSDAAFRLRLSEPRGALESHPSLPPDGGGAFSLQAVIAATADHVLNAQARSALATLAALSSPRFSEEAARQVCSTDDLDALVDAGLLESEGDGFYRLHPTIADYARLRFSQARNDKQ